MRIEIASICFVGLMLCPLGLAQCNNNDCVIDVTLGFDVLENQGVLHFQEHSDRQKNPNCQDNNGCQNKNNDQENNGDLDNKNGQENNPCRDDTICSDDIKKIDDNSNNTLDNDTDAKPCAARQIAGQSVVCECNSTYCDTIIREVPNGQQYVMYTSSESGLRFNKTTGSFHKGREKDKKPDNCTPKIMIDSKRKYQIIEGFGGAVTDAAGINWMKLKGTVRNKLIHSYFGKSGLQYNMIRVPIGGTDFSTHAYAYNEHPENDEKLSNYTLSTEDYMFKIPMINAIMQASSEIIHIVATTWSPPPWMKTNNAYTGYSLLKPEYYQTYADYHLKFIEKYSSEGIPIWAVTTTNEPTAGRIGFCNKINCLGWNAMDMARWIIENLGPTIKNSSFKDVKILLGDDQRLTLPYWVDYLVLRNPKVLDFITGFAVHYYTDFITPASILGEVASSFPDKILIATEACEGTFWKQKHVELGSWLRAKRYILDIITDINHGVSGWIDWNMCLNAEGGPTYIENFADSPIIVFPEHNMFVKQPMYYAMGHMSKFVPRGSHRVHVTHECHKDKSLSSVAFVTPYSTIVSVIYNDGPAKTVEIHFGEKLVKVEIEANSITTIEVPEENYLCFNSDESGEICLLIVS